MTNMNKKIISLIAIALIMVVGTIGTAYAYHTSFFGIDCDGFVQTSIHQSCSDVNNLNDRLNGIQQIEIDKPAELLNFELNGSGVLSEQISVSIEINLFTFDSITDPNIYGQFEIDVINPHGVSFPVLFGLQLGQQTIVSNLNSKAWTSSGNYTIQFELDDIIYSDTIDMVFEPIPTIELTTNTQSLNDGDTLIITTVIDNIRPNITLDFTVDGCGDGWSMRDVPVGNGTHVFELIYGIDIPLPTDDYYCDTINATVVMYPLFNNQMGFASETINITPLTPIVSEPPTQPHLDDIESTTLEVDWSDPSENGSSITGYVIERSLNNVDWSVIVADTGSTSTKADDTELDPETTYYYRISAINGIGTSQPSLVASGTTQP